MKYRELNIAVIIVLFVSLIEWVLCQFSISKGILLTVIFTGCMLKVGYIMFRCFRRIVSISHKDVPYHSFLGFVALNIFLVVVAFSLDYYFVYRMDPNSFSGLETAQTPIQYYFKLFYLSLLLFTNMGVANVVPVTIPAEALVMMEAIASFGTLIFILSDYVTLRESLNRIRANKRHGHLKRAEFWMHREKRRGSKFKVQSLKKKQS